MPPPTHDLCRAVLAMVMVSGCGQDGLVVDTLHEATALAQSMTQTIRDAPDKRQGVAQAQALLEEQRGTLQRDIVHVKGLRSWQVDDEVDAEFTPALVDSLAAVEGLRRELSVPIAMDPELGRQLDTLVTEFAALLSAHPER